MVELHAPSALVLPYCLQTLGPTSDPKLLTEQFLHKIWAILGDLGAILRPSRAILGHLRDLGAILKPSWAILGSSWGHLAPSSCHLGSSWDHLEACVEENSIN